MPKFLIDGNQITVEDDCPEQYRESAVDALHNEFRRNYERMFTAQLQEIFDLILKHRNVFSSFEVSGAIAERLERMLDDLEIYDCHETDRPEVSEFLGEVNSMQFKWHRELLGVVCSD